MCVRTGKNIYILNYLFEMELKLMKILGMEELEHKHKFTKF